MTKLLSSVGVAIAVAAMSMLAGCQLYFGNSGSGGNGDDVGSGGGSGTPGGSPPGFKCDTSAQCAAGCFCAEGICTEGGFCGADRDCGSGFHCDTARSSCIPNPQCVSDNECTLGSACNTSAGACEVTCACANDADAITKGFGWCDEDRGTCMKGADPAGACLGTITCTAAAPVCPEGQVALVKDGCFTGKCRVIGVCEAAPACPALQHQDDCVSRAADCTPLFTGHDCHGTTCGTSDDDCTCDSYTFQSCDVKGTPLTIFPES